MSQEQDAIFLRTFTIVPTVLTVFGIFAAIMGRRFGNPAQTEGSVAEQPPAATDTTHE
ncbi:MAG: hypothetical protein HONDAALG_04559 [Gammaproteobacteria bacterium]|nr:hypothetical protein [Gammaproteobacteria bacterium]